MLFTEAMVIGNEASRQTAAEFGRVPEALEALGIRVTSCQTAHGNDELLALVRHARRSKTKLLVVGGGDGTMTRVVGELAHSDTTLGVIPLGTGNSFAQSLGIAKNIDDAVRVIARGESRKIDLGMVNGLHFANFATIGLSSIIAGRTPRFLKKVMGAYAYLLAGIGPAISSETFRLSLRADKGRFDGRVHQVILASGRYYGNEPLLPQASVFSRRLAVFTATNAGVLGVAREFAALTLGTAASEANGHWWIAKRVSVKAKPRQRIAIDGEVIGKTPAEFRIDAAALRVMVPKGFNGYA